MGRWINNWRRGRCAPLLSPVHRSVLKPQHLNIQEKGQAWTQRHVNSRHSRPQLLFCTHRLQYQAHRPRHSRTQSTLTTLRLRPLTTAISLSLTTMNSLSQLTPLLPSTPYILAYSLPLLLLSLVLTFAGTFLTLDRSRSFPSRGTGTVYSSLALPGALDQPKSKKKLTWALEGGIGGLIGGYVFGGAFELPLFRNV